METEQYTTLYVDRLAHALQLLCGSRPHDDLIMSWIHDKENNSLQAWAAKHGPSWSQGIIVIDAAMLLADNPTEGEDHQYLEDLLRHD